MAATAQPSTHDTFTALTACFSTDLAALINEDLSPGDITPTAFIDLVERGMYAFCTANRDHLKRASEELDYALGELTDALTLTGSDQRDRLARARTHLRYALEITR
ncbi:hypothetical protein [Streptomyces sp. NPDC000878]